MLSSDYCLFILYSIKTFMRVKDIFKCSNTFLNLCTIFSDFVYCKMEIKVYYKNVYYFLLKMVWKC